uniref:Uncharacterized protein n=1 Tax=Arundo donax TaxID=35708 RepID=A0A0A9H5Y0_ARUDO
MFHALNLSMTLLPLLHLLLLLINGTHVK